MKHWKIAIFLAIIGAIAAPFLLGTYKLRPAVRLWVPYTAAEKESISTELNRTNCQEGERLEQIACNLVRSRKEESLNNGGEFREYYSVPIYWAFNGGAAVAGFVFVFALAFFVPALTRRLRKG